MHLLLWFCFRCDVWIYNQLDFICLSFILVAFRVLNLSGLRIKLRLFVMCMLVQRRKCWTALLWCFDDVFLIELISLNLWMTRDKVLNCALQLQLWSLILQKNAAGVAAIAVAMSQKTLTLWPKSQEKNLNFEAEIAVSDPLSEPC